MAELRVYGFSDDCVEFEGHFEKEYNHAADEPWVGNVFAGEKPLFAVIATCAHSDCWAIGVAPISEDKPMPDWSMQIRAAKGDESTYSSVLVIQVPDDLTLTVEPV